MPGEEGSERHRADAVEYERAGPMPETARHRRPVEDRIIAAEVALEERLPGIARLFLAGIPPPSLTASSRAVRGRFLRALQASRIGAPV